MRHPHPLPKELLEKLSTHRLLQVLKVARKHEVGLWCSCCQMPMWQIDGSDEAEWNARKAEIETYMANIKAVLATREHVERPAH